MTIYWRGRGILGVIIPFVLILIPTFIGKDNQLVASTMAMLAGIIVFVLGNKWNAKEHNLELDQNELNENSKIAKHSLFWVAMEYWGVLFLFFGLASLINELFDLNFIDLIHGICFLGLLVMMFINRRREKKHLKKIKAKSNETNVKVVNQFKNRSANKLNSALGENSNSNTINENKMKGNSEKNKIFEELRNIRNKEKSFKPTNHEDFMPKRKERQSLTIDDDGISPTS